MRPAGRRPRAAPVHAERRVRSPSGKHKSRRHQRRRRVYLPLLLPEFLIPRGSRTPTMALASSTTLLGTLVAAIVLWKIASRRASPDGLSDVRGPERERWLTGEC